MMRKINEKGRSMVEMMGYMAVVMTVIVAIGKMVTNIFDEYKVSQASLQLSDLAAAISKAGAMEKDYKEVVDDVNGSHKYVPQSYRIAGNKIFNILGGEVTVDKHDDGGKFSVIFSGLRRKQCIELAMKDWRRNQNVDLYALGVNGEFSFWPVYKSDAAGVLPMTRIRLTGKGENDLGLCNLATGNTVTWIFN